MLQDLSDSEIPNFDNALFGQEDILAFQVSVKNLPIVNVLHAEAQLSEPFQNLTFWEVSTPLSFDLVLQITP